MTPDTIDHVLMRLTKPNIARLDAPSYAPDPVLSKSGVCIGMCVPSMQNHTTSEGWELFKGLEAGGYRLGGYGLGPGTDVRRYLADYNIRTVVVQDVREYEGKTAGPGFDRRESFTGVNLLSSREDIFRLTVLKDAQHNPVYHRNSALEIGAHAWIVYYHPRIVSHLAPYVRQEHLVRTYHTVDMELVPPFRGKRFGSPDDANGRRTKALLSGAVSNAYPIRQRLMASRGSAWFKQYVDILPHPGYGRNKCYTPEYLQHLSQYRVAICTASTYGYALRKIIEATACGCCVITDLPVDDVLPGIDGNLVRVPNCATPFQIEQTVIKCVQEYNPDKQEFYAQAALTGFDFRVVGAKLAADIERLRVNYRRDV